MIRIAVRCGALVLVCQGLAWADPQVPPSAPVTVVNTGANPVPVQGNVAVSGGNVSVVGNVGISGTADVNVKNTVAVTGTVAIAGTPTVSVGSAAPITGSVSITGTPKVNVTNDSLPPVKTKVLLVKQLQSGTNSFTLSDADLATCSRLRIDIYNQSTSTDATAHASFDAWAYAFYDAHNGRLAVVSDVVFAQVGTAIIDFPPAYGGVGVAARGELYDLYVYCR